MLFSVRWDDVMGFGLRFAGMNLRSRVEDSDGWFRGVVLVSIGVAVASFFIGMLIFYRLGVLFS